MVDLNYEQIPVVLLAAGEAKRLQPLSEQMIKPIVPIAGIPIINRIISNYYNFGFKNFIIVISNDEKGIKNSISNMKICQDDEIKVQYIIQEKQIGMADAILKTEDILKESKDKIKYFFVSAVDVLFNEEMPKMMIEKHISSNADMTLSLVYSSDKNMGIGHGNVSIDEKNQIKRIIEKPGPDKIIGNYYSMPIYIFPIQLMDYIKRIEKSERGELEVQDAIQLMIKEGKKSIGVNILPEIKNFSLDNVGAYHLTYVKDVLPMNFRFLQEGKFEFEGEYPTTIEPVNSEDIVKCGDNVLLGPNVYISESCELDNLVEIFASILYGNNKIGKSTIIENSIIGKNVVIQSNEKIQNKIILYDEEKDENKIYNL